MDAESNKAQTCPFIDSPELEAFQRAKYTAYYWWVVLHELLGHGTGRMMVEESPGKFNFDPEAPPVDPLTGEPIKSWYEPGQTWTGQFEDLATTVDECRAELVGAYLMDDTELLRLIGFNDNSDVTNEDCKDISHKILTALLIRCSDIQYISAVGCRRTPRPRQLQCRYHGNQGPMNSLLRIILD